MTSSAYSHYSPYRSKQSADPHIAYANNPFGDNSANYLATGAMGAGLGGSVGALVQAIRGKSIGNGILLGGGIGAGLGMGQKYLSDSEYPVRSSATRLTRDAISGIDNTEDLASASYDNVSEKVEDLYNAGVSMKDIVEGLKSMFTGQGEKQGTSGKAIDAMLDTYSDKGQQYAGLGGGALGALLGAGVGGLTAGKGNRLRNALIGAGIGGASGGAAGYFGSPHVSKGEMKFVDTDNSFLGLGLNGEDASRPNTLSQALGRLDPETLQKALKAFRSASR